MPTTPPRFPPIAHRFPPRLPVKLPVLNRFFASRKHRIQPICLAFRLQFSTRFRASPALEKTVLPTIPRGRSPPTSPRFSRVVCGFEIVGHMSGLSKVVGSPPPAGICVLYKMRQNVFFLPCRDRNRDRIRDREFLPDYYFSRKIKVTSWSLVSP